MTFNETVNDLFVDHGNEMNNDSLVPTNFFTENQMSSLGLWSNQFGSRTCNQLSFDNQITSPFQMQPPQMQIESVLNCQRCENALKSGYGTYGTELMKTSLPSQPHAKRCKTTLSNSYDINNNYINLDDVKAAIINQGYAQDFENSLQVRFATSDD